MTLQSFDPNCPVTVTPVALEQLRKRASRYEGIPRLKAEVAGCSGYKYVLGVVDAPEEEDVIINLDGVQLAVDSTSLAVLKGVEMDYEMRSEMSLNERFVFRNPNATGECGCGESFYAEP